MTGAPGKPVPALGCALRLESTITLWADLSKKFLIWMIDRGGEFACEAACASKKRLQTIGELLGRLQLQTPTTCNVNLTYFFHFDVL